MLFNLICVFCFFLPVLFNQSLHQVVKSNPFDVRSLMFQSVKQKFPCRAHKDWKRTGFSGISHYQRSHFLTPPKGLNRPLKENGMKMLVFREVVAPSGNLKDVQCREPGTATKIFRHQRSNPAAHLHPIPQPPSQAVF